MMDAQDLVFEFESDCESFAADIRKKMLLQKKVLVLLKKNLKKGKPKPLKKI